MEYSHKCIKCQKEYTDTDPDPYYCASCNAERKIIAKQIEKKMAHTISTKAPSALKEYDNAPKVRGFMIVKL